MKRPNLLARTAATLIAVAVIGWICRLPLMALAEVFVGSDAAYQVEGSSAFCWGFLCILGPLKPEIVEVDSSATATPLPDAYRAAPPLAAP